MSLSNPRPENPVKKFIKYKGSTGKFEYYDKETETNIEIPLERIGFIVLDELSAISGYHPQAESGIYSNEITDLKHEILNVKVHKSNILISGLYENIKDNAKAIGGKFTKSVYAALITSKTTLELVNFQFSGSGLNGWIEKKINVNKEGVKVTSLTDGVKGATKFKTPVFEGFPMPVILLSMAIEMDKELQEYLKQYKSLQIEKAEATSEAQEVVNQIHKNGSLDTGVALDDLVPQGEAEDDDDSILPF